MVELLSEPLYILAQARMLCHDLNVCLRYQTPASTVHCQEWLTW
jgi:hypothetical protein